MPNFKQLDNHPLYREYELIVDGRDSATLRVKLILFPSENSARMIVMGHHDNPQSLMECSVGVPFEWAAAMADYRKHHNRPHESLTKKGVR